MTKKEKKETNGKRKKKKKRNKKTETDVQKLKIKKRIKNHIDGFAILSFFHIIHPLSVTCFILF